MCKETDIGAETTHQVEGHHLVCLVGGQPREHRAGRGVMVAGILRQLHQAAHRVA